MSLTHRHTLRTMATLQWWQLGALKQLAGVSSKVKLLKIGAVWVYLPPKSNSTPPDSLCHIIQLSINRCICFDIEQWWWLNAVAESNHGGAPEKPARGPAAACSLDDTYFQCKSCGWDWWAGAPWDRMSLHSFPSVFVSLWLETRRKMRPRHGKGMAVQ